MAAVLDNNLFTGARRNILTIANKEGTGKNCSNKINVISDD